MTAPGWYDDPWNPAQQRYWDGAQWTPQQRVRPGPPPYPGQFGGPAYGFGPAVPSTPDGVPLAGWWLRVLATVIDGAIVFVAALPLTGYFWFRYLGATMDSTETDLVATEPWTDYRWYLAAALINLIVNFGYHFLFLTRAGATPGKMAVGISVRLREVPGPPPGPAVARRVGTSVAFSAVGFLPGAYGIVLGLLALFDVLWPLWDDKKQALHDKVAQTNVVRGKAVKPTGQPSVW